MDAKELQSGDLATIATRPISLEINFSSFEKIQFVAKEIKLCILIGEIGSRHDFNKCNIVATKFRKTSSHHADFANIDFKDCIFTDCNLNESKFSDGAIASTFFNNSELRECSFRDVSITESEFRHVTFRHCDFSKLLIKTCRFYHCSFVDCVTSNKLFESSLLLECTFNQTSLEFGTISSNFGIIAEHVNSELRGFPQPTPDEALDSQGYLGRLAREFHLSTVEVFRVNYYFNAEEALISEVFDSCLSGDSWEELIWMPSSFVSTFTDFVDFLLHLFDTDKLPVFVLWRLQALTASLAGRLENQSREISGLLLRPLAGIQMTLAQLIEEQINIQTELCELYQSEVTFLVNGPLNPAFYLSEFEYWFESSSAEITRLVPHNSPAELTILAKSIGDITPFIALLVCTRFSLEIQKLRFDTTKALAVRSNRKSSDSNNLPATSNEISAFSLSVGLTKDRKAYELKLMTMLPGDHFLKFMFQLRLDVTTRTISRAKSILHNIIDRDG